MVLEFKNLTMVIIMQESMLMASRKVMENIIGVMEVFTKVISVMEQDMDMVSGRIKIKHILAHIKWTIKKALEFIHGKIKRYTKDNSKMIIEMVMVNFLLLTD